MKACIIGSTGYAGQQLATLLQFHPMITQLYLGSFGSADELMSEKYPHLNQVMPLRLIKAETLMDPAFILKEKIDVIFMALPHGLSSEPIHLLLQTGVKIIDLGADYRIKNPTNYAKWYGEHPHPLDLPKSVYGLSEVYKQSIAAAQLIANPGCYATATLLGALPAVSMGLIGSTPLMVDAKSGISGAGRQASIGSLFSEVAENVRPYNIGSHRHTPEIEQELTQSTSDKKDVKILFSPSVVPMSRGMISAVYAPLEKEVTPEQIKALYAEFYQGAPFIRLTDSPPVSKSVRGSNYADLWVHVDERTNTFVAMTAIDNLVKGASGQAVQNMNIMMGYEEHLGLTTVPLYP